MAKKRKTRKKRRKQGTGRVAAVVLAGAVCCWLGLVKVDRQIRAVTINQSPPLWEAREEGDLVFLTIMGSQGAVDLGPVRRLGRMMGEEAKDILRTPSAPERVWGMIKDGISG